jgi:hypothetical protein
LRVAVSRQRDRPARLLFDRHQGVNLDQIPAKLIRQALDHGRLIVGQIVVLAKVPGQVEEFIPTIGMAVLMSALLIIR